MYTTAEQIRAAQSERVPIKDLYVDLEADLNYDDIVEATMEDDHALTWITPKSLAGSYAEPAYASAHFVEKLKPIVKVSKITGNPYWTVKAAIISSAVTVEQATAYLWWYAGTVKARLPEQEGWQSYEVPIGVANQEISAQSLLRAVESTDTEIAGSEEVGGADERLWVALLCAAPYRVPASLREDYRNQLTTRIHEYSKTLGVTAETLVMKSYLGRRGHWEQDENYSKVVAAIDMFFIRFQGMKEAKVRLCTISARYKDCAALVGFEYLKRIRATSFGELLLWIWTESTATDIKRVLKKGEELDNLFSYLPYISSMRLSPKSPYSASINSSLHYFIHLTGAMMGQLRSTHARLI